MNDQDLKQTGFENEEEFATNALTEGADEFSDEEWLAGEDIDEDAFDSRLRREKEREERDRKREEKRKRLAERTKKERTKQNQNIGDVDDANIDMPVIQFCNVTKDYENSNDDKMALEDVSFEIRKGEFVFIVGPSGSGKSTMIRLMMKEISPTEGTIYVAGRDLSRLKKSQVARYRREIGIVFQDFRLLNDRNVYENVAFAQQVIGQPKAKIPREVAKMLSLVGLSTKYKNRPTELSGGEQQRVALARALVNNPMILLADEPTGNLDPQNSWEIMNLLEEVNRRGTTVVVVTHNSEIVDQMQKRVIMVRNGLIEEDKKGGYVHG